jgi:5-(carboxyamino)imidazole ribonucleotide synthase
VTVEFENVSARGLRWLGRRLPTRPHWRVVWTSQNRLREKRFLQHHGFPVAPWSPIRSPAECATAAAQHRFPAILKTAASGYDGKGQIALESPADLPAAWRALRHAPCVLESRIAFQAELSVVTVRAHDGASATYPVCFNRHSRHILDSTLAPAEIGPALTQEARDLAQAIAARLGSVGVLTVEFFLTTDGQLLVNELAPRPHNSGHLTIEAAVCSQFEQQVRALAGLPLGSDQLLAPAAMVNLLGDLWQAGPPHWDRMLRAFPAAKLHLYGKLTPEPGRKMGHLTILATHADTALEQALAARRLLNPTREHAPVP